MLYYMRNILEETKKTSKSDYIIDYRFTYLFIYFIYGFLLINYFRIKKDQNIYFLLI